MRKETAKNLLRFIPAAMIAILSVSCEKDKLTVTDVDGNVYNTVEIGTQVWMASDLKTTKFRDGSAIPVVTANSSWAALTTAGTCDYGNDAAKGAVYGKLYNFYTVADARGLCPAGWHVPTQPEWGELMTTLGLEVSANKMREVGTAHWTSPHSGTTNETGFTALGGGYRNYLGEFKELNWTVGYWSSTSNSSIGASHVDMYSFDPDLKNYGIDKKTGLYIRCMQDK